MDTQTHKHVLLEALYEPYKKCTRCPLGSLGRQNVVFGSGNPNATIMFIGEGPGQKEDEQGKPFVGRSGALLNKALKIAGLTREDVYISNIVKCRPPKNRTPLKTEMSICKKLLLEKQITIIRPHVICTLGAAALSGLCERAVKITKERGTPLTLYNTTIIPTYHPAYILRNPKQLEHLVADIKIAIKMAKSA